MNLLDEFQEVWVVDFEFTAEPGCKPDPICMVAMEIRSGRNIELWKDDLINRDSSLLPSGEESLFVAYYAPAEMGCYLALNWAMPTYVLDLYTEFRSATNGCPLPSGRGLLGALVYYGLDGMSVAEKDGNRDLILRGGPYTPSERDRIISYCRADVVSTAKLLQAMRAKLAPQAILRGRHAKAIAEMEFRGIPIDPIAYPAIRDGWENLRTALVEEIDSEFEVYEGTTFKQARFRSFLADRGISWPVTDTGQLKLDEDTFRMKARTNPEIKPLAQLRGSLGKLRRMNLGVGPDSRNRTMLSPFSSKTGRNQPSTSKFIFGAPAWMRGVIRPPEGWALSYIDWSQQEFGIAAKLSGDSAMQRAYLSGDPYLGVAMEAGAVPRDATKKSHPTEREMFKVTTLALQYGQTEYGLAQTLGVTIHEARELMRIHRRAFPKYWKWSEAVENHTLLTRKVQTIYGWTYRLHGKPNPRSIRNFPMQANGAEILRLACCFATERGIRVCAPVHDALLIEAPLDEIDDSVKRTQMIMKEAGEIVLNGFPLRSDADTIRFPDRYRDPRGERMWGVVTRLLGIPG